MSEIGATLVTGAYGLIGHAVVLALQSAGRPVIPTDRLETPPDDAQFRAASQVVADPARLYEFLSARRIDTVVHCAGYSGPMLARDQPHIMFSVNVGGTLDLLEAARLAGVRRVILLSSAAVYGRTGDEIVGETAPLRAKDAYGASKVAAEYVARSYASAHNLEVVALRPSWVYGPRRRTECIIRTMLLDAIAARATRLPYGRGHPRQFVHVTDVAAAVIAAIAAPSVSGQSFNITDGIRRTLDEVALIVRSILPEAQIQLDEREDTVDDDYVGLLDINRAENHLNWRPQITLEAGIRSYSKHLASLFSAGGR